MGRILTIFGTGEGQTAKVAERIDAELRAHGHESTTVNVKELGPNIDIRDYDAVLVGASIHMGKHQKAVRKFVKTNRDTLGGMPTGFFQVSGSSGEGTEEGAAKAAKYVDEFIEETGWYPDRIALFGGALRFSEYGFLMRTLVKFVARANRSGTNPLADVEYTDWDEVRQFAEAFGEFVEEQLSLRSRVVSSAEEGSQK